MGLTEPGRKPERPSSRFLTFSFVLWSLSAALWLTQAVLYSADQLDRLLLYLITGAISLILAIAYFVMWRTSNRDQTVPAEPPEG